MTANNNKKTAFISGAAGGLGQQAAALFDKLGYRLWLSDFNQQQLDDLKQRYPDAIIDQTDLTDPQQLEALCQVLEAYSDELAIAYINAGISLPGRVIDLQRNQLKAQLDINLNAAVFLMHACAKKMAVQKSGHIIATASTAALISLQDGAPYSASKFGLRGFLIALAAELKPLGISVSALYPNAIDTPMLRFEAANGGSSLNFLGDPLKPEQVIAALEKALKGKKLEYFIPAADSLTARLVCTFPGLLNRFYPLLNWLGEKGRSKYLRSLKP